MSGQKQDNILVSRSWVEQAQVRVNAHDALVRALRQLNHMGGDDRGGYCICPRQDGSAADDQHSSGCADARAALNLAEGEKSPTGGESRSK
jgi:hypothetical protein